MLKILLASIRVGLFTSLILGCTLLYGPQAIAGGASAPQEKSVTKPSWCHSLKNFCGIVGVFAVMPDAPSGWHPVLSRSDCLVQVRIEKKGEPVTAKEWFRINYRSGPIWLFEAPKFGLAAYIYRQRSRSLYLLYAKNCEKKFRLTKELFAQMKASIKGFPDYEVLHHRIEPSSKTLNICGHWWKDGEKGECHISLPRSMKRMGGSGLAMPH